MNTSLNTTRRILAACALLLLLPGAAAAVEFISVDFLSRPGELRALFQLSGPGAGYREDVPMPGKLLVEVGGLCKSYDSPEEQRALIGQGLEACSDGRPNASLLRLYKFERSLPVHQLNVVNLGTGKVQLIWRLRGAGVPHQVSMEGDQLEILFGARPTETPSRTAGARARAGSAQAASARRMPPRAPSPRPDVTLPPGVTSTPIGKADTVFGPPDPAFLPQSRDYRVGAGDRLQFVVHADERLTRESLQIAATGYIDLPLLGSLPVAGRNVSEIEGEIERLLGEKYLRDPDVTVLVVEYNSQFVNVLGAVTEAGRVALKGRTTLMDVISEVGGTTDKASGSIVVHRKGETKPVHMRLDDLLSGIEGTNLLLRTGDTINVETKKYFFVSGEVKAPGKYELEPGMTIIDAIAVAGGATEYGQKDKSFLLRTVDGERRRMEVNPKAIERGKEKNVEILPRDHIKVPPKYF